MASSAGGETFTFNWSIENFSMCGNHIVSPVFVADVVKKTGWSLQIFPSDYDAKHCTFVIWVMRSKIRENEPLELTVSISTTILSNGSNLNKKIEKISLELGTYARFEHTNIPILVENVNPGNKAYLSCSVRTIQCSISLLDSSNLPEIKDGFLKLDTDYLFKEEIAVFTKENYQKRKRVPNELSVHTQTEVEQRSISLFVENFSKMPNRHKDFLILSSASADFPSLLVVFRLNENHQIHFEVHRSTTVNKLCLSCTIDAVNKHGVSVKSLKDKHTFYEESVWSLTSYFDRSELLKDNLFFMDDVLCLRFEFAISCYGSLIHTMRYIRFPDYSFNSRTRVKSSIASDTMARLYEDKKRCDVTLTVRGVQLTAHKAIVCSASPVFDAMFDNDMKENNTGEVNISDFDWVTIDRLLRFVYSSELRLEDMVCKDVIALYSAADKYQITELKDGCSDFLRCVLAEGNVCDIFELAELHHDGALKQSAIDFISNIAAKIYTRDKWRKVLQKKPELATEVMHEYTKLLHPAI